MLSYGKDQPHFVVSGDENLGVVVTECPAEPMQLGDKVKITVVFVYEFAVDYSALVEGTLLDLMENSRIVARGRVLHLVGELLQSAICGS